MAVERWLCTARRGELPSVPRRCERHERAQARRVRFSLIFALEARAISLLPSLPTHSRIAIAIFVSILLRGSQFRFPLDGLAIITQSSCVKPKHNAGRSSSRVSYEPFLESFCPHSSSLSRFDSRLHRPASVVSTGPKFVESTPRID